MVILFPPRRLPASIHAGLVPVGWRSAGQRAFPGEVPVLADHVPDSAVLLEEFVRPLEHGDHQRAFGCPGGVPANRGAAPVRGCPSSADRWEWAGVILTVRRPGMLLSTAESRISLALHPGYEWSGGEP